MPQVFHVVQCYNCHVYQVDIVKKLPKWSCKMCSEKQSLKKIYCKGTGKDCRLVVQDLNETRIKLETSMCHQLVDEPLAETKQHEDPLRCVKSSSQTKIDTGSQNSKWLEFLGNNSESNEGNIHDKPKLEYPEEIVADNSQSFIRFMKNIEPVEDKPLQFEATGEISERDQFRQGNNASKENTNEQSRCDEKILDYSVLNCKKSKLDLVDKKTVVMHRENIFDDNNCDVDVLLEL